MARKPSCGNKPRSSKKLASLAGKKLATSTSKTTKKLAANVLGNRKKR